MNRCLKSLCSRRLSTVHSVSRGERNLSEENIEPITRGTHWHSISRGDALRLNWVPHRAFQHPSLNIEAVKNAT